MNPHQYQLDNIQFEHSLWLNELAHAFSEISIYQKRINGLIEVKFEIDGQEELKNLLLDFGMQKTAIEFIKNQILKHLVDIQKKAQSNGALKEILDNDHDEIRERIHQFRNDYAEVKKLFNNIIEWQK